MIAILSPAKRMRGAQYSLAVSKPAFFKKTTVLARALQALSPWQLETVLKTNPKLALDAFAFYQAFSEDVPGIPAILSYQGLAYQHLDALSFTEEDLRYANDHLRLLSAFYGLLRPLDGIQPYRLELLSRLRIDGQSLYRFWGDCVYRALFAAGEPVVNLASGEYARLITPYLTPQDSFIDCAFITERRAKRVTVATEAKMARGELARYLVTKRLQTPDGLRCFSFDGYEYHPRLSSESTYVFYRSGQ